MPILNLAIGQSRYTINCDDGEEEKILELAKKLNERVNNLSLSVRTDEKTTLMLCALMIEEELVDLKNNKGILENPNQDDENIFEEKLIIQIQNTTEQICALTKKIKNEF